MEAGPRAVESRTSPQATLLETWLARSHSILGGSGGQDESEPVQVALEERDRASLLTLQFTAPPQGGAVRSQAVTRAVGAQVRSSRLEACAQAQGERGPLKVRVPQAGPRPGWSIRLLSCSGSLLPAGVVRAGERVSGRAALQGKDARGPGAKGEDPPSSPSPHPRGPGAPRLAFRRSELHTPGT